MKELGWGTIVLSCVFTGITIACVIMWFKQPSINRNVILEAEIVFQDTTGNREKIDSIAVEIETELNKELAKFDRSINVLDSSFKLMAVIATIFGIMVAFLGIFGFFNLSQVSDIREKAEKDVQEKITEIDNEKTAIIEIKKEIDDEKTAITDIKEEIDREKTAITDMKSEIDREKTAITYMKSEIGKEKTSITIMKGEIEIEKDNIADMKGEIEIEKNNIADMKNEVEVASSIILQYKEGLEEELIQLRKLVKSNSKILVAYVEDGKKEVPESISNALYRFNSVYEALRADYQVNIGKLSHEEYFALGVASFNKKDFERAIKKFDEIKKPNNNKLYALALTKKASAKLHLFKQERRKDKKAEPDIEIIELLKKASKLDKAIALTFYNKGMYYYYKKDYDNAIKYYGKSIETNPLHKYSYNMKSICYFKKGMELEGVQILEKVISRFEESQYKQTFYKWYYNLACFSAKLYKSTKNSSKEKDESGKTPKDYFRDAIRNIGISVILEPVKKRDALTDKELKTIFLHWNDFEFKELFEPQNTDNEFLYKEVLDIKTKYDLQTKN